MRIDKKSASSAAVSPGSDALRSGAEGFFPSPVEERTVLPGLAPQEVAPMRFSPLLRPRPAFAALLAVSLLGCAAATAEGALRERAAKERACSPDRLSVTSLGASAYKVEGCGAPETFICIEYHGWVCTKEGGPQSAERVRHLVDQARSYPQTRHPEQEWPFVQASSPTDPIPVQNQGGPFLQ